MEEYWWWKYGKSTIILTFSTNMVLLLSKVHNIITNILTHIDPITLILIMSLCSHFIIRSFKKSLEDQLEFGQQVISPQLSNGWYSSYNCCFGRQGEEVKRWPWQKKKLRQFSFSKEFIWHVQNIHHLPLNNYFTLQKHNPEVQTYRVEAEGEGLHKSINAYFAVLF